MKLKAIFASFLVIASFACIPLLSNAQLPGDPNGDPDPDQPHHGVPIDGGLSLLIAAGVGYATKKAYDKRKRESINTDF